MLLYFFENILLVSHGVNTWFVIRYNHDSPTGQLLFMSKKILNNTFKFSISLLIVYVKAMKNDEN